VHNSKRTVDSLPSLGLACEVTVLKCLKGAKWESNDLYDLQYLVYAAGYADAVVGERVFVSLICDAAKRLGREVNAFPSIRALSIAGILPPALSG
jgi:hypothetical protein